MSRPEFSINRDRLAPRLAECARKLLNDPTPAVVNQVGRELDRLSRG